MNQSPDRTHRSPVALKMVDAAEADKLCIKALVKRLDQVMASQPSGRWVRDGELWKCDHCPPPSSPNEEAMPIENYSYVDRRILPDGRVKAGFVFLENGQETGQSEHSTYLSLEDLIQVELMG